MRKVKIILPILILFAGILLYLQFGRDVEVISTTSTTSDQFYEQGMTVVANKLIIPDKVIKVYPNRICMKLCRGSWNIEYENGEMRL